MAYLSREFWNPDDRRRELGETALPATAGPGGVPAAAGAPGVASAGGAPPSDTGSGQPGALRAFFELNKDQGGRVLGGLADSLNQRISGTQAGLEQVPATAPEAPMISLPNDAFGLSGDAQAKFNAQLAAYNQAQQAKAAGAKEALGRNQAAAAGLAQDVNRLGTAEGQQSLLEQQYASGNYTPGQARLDAWLTGAAANQQPGLVGGVQQAYGRLQSAASTPPPGQAGPDALKQWLGQSFQQQLGAGPLGRYYKRGAQ